MPLPAPTTLYLVRHGETAWNVQHRFQGHRDIPLNEEGERQAAALGRWFLRQRVSFQALYTSDLARAARTAEIIGDSLALVPVPMPELREIDCGAWSGLGSVEIEEQYPGGLQHWRERGYEFRLPGGESVPEVRQRVLAVFDAIVDLHRGEAIIVVTHGIVLNTLLTALHRWEPAAAWRDGRARMGNTGVTVVEWNAATGTSVPSLLNSRQHLDETCA